MKLKKFAPLALLLPLTLLAACGGTPELDLHANWYANEMHQHISDASETLVYDVIYTPAENVTPIVPFTYETGRYTAVLQEHSSLANEADWATGTGYTYVTEFSISGSYTIGGKETDFTDTIRSEVSFANIDDMLRPVKSYKEFHVTTPYGGSVIQYAYIYRAAYNQKLTETEISVKDLREDVKEEEKLDFTKKMKLKGSGTFFDNEQILFALRALDLKSACSFRTVNPVTHERVGVTMASTPKEGTTKGSFLINGTQTEELTLATVSFSIGYTSKKSGLTQKLTYALPGEKSFRNALISMETAAPDGCGSFVYRLKELTTFDK